MKLMITKPRAQRRECQVDANAPYSERPGGQVVWHDQLCLLLISSDFVLFCFFLSLQYYNCVSFFFCLWHCLSLALCRRGHAVCSALLCRLSRRQTLLKFWHFINAGDERLRTFAVRDSTCMREIFCQRDSHHVICQLCVSETFLVSSSERKHTLPPPLPARPFKRNVWKQ